MNLRPYTERETLLEKHAGLLEKEVHCKRCNGKLYSAASRALGMGERCTRLEAASKEYQDKFFQIAQNFTLFLLPMAYFKYRVYDQDNIIVIEDEKVNGAAIAYSNLNQLLEQLTADLVDPPENYLFLVRNSDGFYDGILPIRHNNPLPIVQNQQEQFRPVVIQETDVRRARKKLLEMHDKGPTAKPLL